MAHGSEQHDLFMARYPDSSHQPTRSAESEQGVGRPDAVAAGEARAARTPSRSRRRVKRGQTLLRVPRPVQLVPETPAVGGQPTDAEDDTASAAGIEIEDFVRSAVAGDWEAPERPAARPLTLVDFADDLDRAEEIGQRTRLVRAMLRGLSAREALLEVGLPETRVRWAQKVFAAWKRDGRLVDGRWERVPAPTVITPVVEQLILRAYHGRRRAGAVAVWRMVRDAIQGAAADAGAHVEIAIPTYEAIRAFLRKLPKSVRLVRDGGIEAWTKHGRPFIDYDPSDYANHIAQIDHTRVKVWVRVEVKPGVWQARVAWLTVVVDLHSRAILGFTLSTRVPDQWSMALALRHGILPKEDPTWPACGIPEVLVPDQGSDFMSHAAARLCKALGMRLDPTPPYYPDMKAEIERFFGTLNSFLSQLVGFMPADGRSPGAAAKRVPMLLTLPELRGEIERFLREYHTRPHAGIDGETPAQRWKDTLRHLAMPASEKELDVLLLKDDVVRTVTKAGIRFTAKWQEMEPPPDTLPEVDDPRLTPTDRKRKGRYWAPELMDYLGEEVRLAYNPEDLESVLVYSAMTGELLCEAWLVDGANGRWTPERIGALRAGYRKGLKERTTEYAKEVERADRRSARARDAARERAHELDVAASADEGTETPAADGRASGAGGTGHTSPAAGASVDDLVAAMDRRARGRA